MSEPSETVQVSTTQCWCCGAEFDERDLVRLGSHPEVGVCFGCARFLQRGAAARQDALVPTWSGRVRGAIRSVRNGVIARDLHNRPVVGRFLRRLDRHLP
ncbi:hypothetical protein E0H75_10295 [Kribbella capetownensis]|uniref:Uncharacterized protein n=1 Tax=Kribbella capetownensis TaxID=1572659 RepID=A0A4R0JT50_9ACTN|nr:hypothetical protein E0H75_10295 [Kribbella capetownensis]